MHAIVHWWTPNWDHNAFKRNSNDDIIVARGDRTYIARVNTIE